MILLSEIRHPEDAATSAKKLLVSISAPMSYRGHDLHIDGSIGISIYPEDGEDAETLIKNADTAMYHAKESGRNNFQFFTAEMNLKSVERQSLESSLRRAIERERVLVALSAQDKSRHRRDHGRRGVDPLAAAGPRTGSSLPIRAHRRRLWPHSPDRQLGLREACRQAREWQAAGLPFKRISVNVSARRISR